MLLKKKAMLMLSWLVLAGGAVEAQQQNNSPLSVEKIMRDPATWIGTSPSNVFWSEDSKKIYFSWNPEGNRRDSLYSVSANGSNLQKVSAQERRALPGMWGARYNRANTQKVFEKNGDIFLLDLKSGRTQQITNTVERENSPSFSHDEKKVAFVKDGNLYLWTIANGQLVQLTDFRKGNKPGEEGKNQQRDWLKEQQLALFQIVRDREADKQAAQKQQKADSPRRPKEIYIGEKTVDNIVLSPDERYVSYRMMTRPRNAKVAIVPDFVTSSGYTEDINTRTKVGDAQATFESFVYDIRRDTTYAVQVAGITGINDIPAYLNEAKASTAKEPATKPAKAEARAVTLFGPVWSDNGRHAVMVGRAADNKDRWILKLDPATGKLSTLDRQRDEAWISGPGIGFGTGDIGFMPDNEQVWFQSEESGYSHLYAVNLSNGNKRALTSGKFEISGPQISKDKKSWYFTANKVHPGEKHFYKMPINGGEMVQLTTGTGGHEVTLSPDEKTLAIRYSYSNKPWELFVQDNRKGAKARQVTQSLKDEFKAYQWREPEVISFKASDGEDVYARLYQPKNKVANGPAVIFVHGAGYLQNAHKWWSTYFREYMFHNFLADNGYTVLDIDYRGSAGYGRDVRTGIYQFMGGKDLSDHVDGAKLLVDKYNVDPKRIGIYGGSYGGFITLMAMFTEPDVFAAGAALRSVTDWAHYNHGYTSNILNVPQLDSLAYAKSSPIYYAEGLKGALLICHGMVDTNVHFQDVVRLTQRLIELGKDNWELAVYPIEDHGFTEPASWTDEYKRIYKLFEENLKK